ncbi:hypothetical protein HAX54_002017, partial [Datura stramonium]|nr:hypothetical protein [Datura stramonium]
KGLARWMFKARHEDGKGMGKGDCSRQWLSGRQVRLGNSVGRGRGFGAQDRSLAPNLGEREAEDVRTCWRAYRPTVMPRRHWPGMTSAGCGSSASGWPMCMAFSQDKADLSDGKEALIKQRARDRRMAPAGH